MVLSPNPSARRSRYGGFTLVEVTLAIAIASFSILSMLGVVAVGMSTMRSAIDATVQAQITQEVISSLRRADFSTLQDLEQNRWSFDDRGLPMESAEGAIYGASVDMEPANLSGGSSNPNLLRVVVSITQISEPGQPRLVSTFIANNGL